MSASRAAASRELRIGPRVQALLRSPCCQSSLVPCRAGFECVSCRAEYTVREGIPVLIKEASSIFQVEDVVSDIGQARTTSSRLKQSIVRSLPQLSRNTTSKINFRKFAQLLVRDNRSPIVLVIGGRILGVGVEELAAVENIEMVETDVVYGPRTALLCDAHDLPFESEAFDGVVIQAVLEHVVDPSRCVAEIYRVLKPEGLVYAEVPFMQQVHAREYDFTRFTHLGLRRLFRRFTEVESGAACGPGMAIAWSYEYLLLSCARSQTVRRLLAVFARFTAFWCKYIDYFVLHKPGALDGASAYYLCGRKSDRELTDRELIASYRGAF